MAEQLPDSFTVRAEQIPTIWRDSVALWLRFHGEVPWHRVTHVSAAKGVTVRFDDTQDKTFAADESIDIVAAKEVGDIPGVEGWLNG